jgi:hypothetical protein
LATHMRRSAIGVTAALALSCAPGSHLQAQPVLLQIRPHVGDTIAVRLEQKVEMIGAPVDCGTDARSRNQSRECSALRRQMTTVNQVFSRAIVQSVSADGSSVLAVTDSVRTAMSREGQPGTPRRVRGRERSIKLRVSGDGGAVVTDEAASEELRLIFGQMPAMLSRTPVRVGGKWTREMRIPIVGESGALGLVRATFRLDSLGRHGDIAYISMRGNLSHDHRDGSTSELDGRMTGTIQLDRRLAWITETHAEIEVTSIFRPASGSEPMRVRTTITQHLKAGIAR